MGKADRERTERRAAAVAARQKAEREAAERGRRNKLFGLIGMGILAVVIVVVVVVIAVGGGSSKSTTASGPVAKTGLVRPPIFNTIAQLPQKGNILGKSTAPVTLTEFVDLQCPFCREYFTNIWPDVVKELVATGKIKVQVETLDFIGMGETPNDSDVAGRAAYAALKENKFFQFADVFYANQKEENTGYVTKTFVTKIAETAGTNPQAAVAAMTDSGDDTLVTAATNEGDALNVHSTPSFYLSKGNSQLKEFMVPNNNNLTDPGPFLASLTQAVSSLS